MKKIVSLVVVVLLLCSSLVGCGSKKLGVADMSLEEFTTQVNDVLEGYDYERLITEMVQSEEDPSEYVLELYDGMFVFKVTDDFVGCAMTYSSLIHSYDDYGSMSLDYWMLVTAVINVLDPDEDVGELLQQIEIFTEYDADNEYSTSNYTYFMTNEWLTDNTMMKYTMIYKK